MRKGRKNICPRCKSEIPEGMAFCQFCMEIIENNGGVVEIESRYKPKVNRWFMAFVITALCILLVMFAVIIFMLANPDKAETEKQSFPELITTEQVTTVQGTDLNAMTTTSTVTDTTTVTKEVINTTSAKTTIIVSDTAEILTDTVVTEPVTEEMPTIQVPQADFETIIRNGFDSWIGLGDAETLSFSEYSCTFSDVIMGEDVDCALTVAEDFRSYVLTISGDEYSTGSFVNGIDEPVRAFTEIVLGYKPTFMGGNIRGSIREMFSNRETSGHITDRDFSCDIEYDSGTQTVTINAYMN